LLELGCLVHLFSLLMELSNLMEAIQICKEMNASNASRLQTFRFWEKENCWTRQIEDNDYPFRG
jgi:hypothetical protein